MSDRPTAKIDTSQDDSPQQRTTGKGRRRWAKPALEDVSAKIMAQPYIRFT